MSVNIGEVLSSLIFSYSSKKSPGLSRFFSFLEFSVIYWIRNNFLILCYVLLVTADPILIYKACALSLLSYFYNLIRKHTAAGRLSLGFLTTESIGSLFPSALLLRIHSVGLLLSSTGYSVYRRNKKK